MPKNLIRMNSNRFEFFSIFLAEQNCFGYNFCIKNPNQLVLVAKFVKNHSPPTVEISGFFAEVGFESFRCSSFLSVLVAFSLGADECVNLESDPQPSIEQQQQGKQFDHINPIKLKSIILLSTYMYMCIAILC